VRCVAHDNRRPCDREPVMADPVPLCAVHSLQIALAVVPGVLRDQMASEAQPVEMDHLLQGGHDPVVYFITHGDRVKIGFTSNLKKRINGLTLRPDSVLLVLTGGPDLERALHARFAADRFDDTEWFQLSPQIKRYIEDRNRQTHRQGERAAPEERRRVVVHKEPTESEQLALLGDLVEILGDSPRMRTQEALQRLAERAPDTYRSWTFQDLTRVLRAAGAPPYPYQGRVSVARHRVLEALSTHRSK